MFHVIFFVFVLGFFFLICFQVQLDENYCLIIKLQRLHKTKLEKYPSVYKLIQFQENFPFKCTLAITIALKAPAIAACCKHIFQQQTL